MRAVETAAERHSGPRGGGNPTEERAPLSLALTPLTNARASLLCVCVMEEK